MVSTNGAFQPYRQGAISGFKQDTKVRYAQLYINRTHSTTLTNSTNYSYAKTLILEPTQDTIRMQIFIDNTIIEAFANNGTSVVTARVYPQKTLSNSIQIMTTQGGTSLTLEAYEMGSALENDIFLDARDVVNSKTVLKAGYELSITHSVSLTYQYIDSPNQQIHGLTILYTIIQNTLVLCCHNVRWWRRIIR